MIKKLKEKAKEIQEREHPKAGIKEAVRTIGRLMREVDRESSEQELNIQKERLELVLTALDEARYHMKQFNEVNNGGRNE